MQNCSECWPCSKLMNLFSACAQRNVERAWSNERIDCSILKYNFRMVLRRPRQLSRRQINEKNTRVRFSVFRAQKKNERRISCVTKLAQNRRERSYEFYLFSLCCLLLICSSFAIIYYFIIFGVFFLQHEIDSTFIANRLTEYCFAVLHID